MRERLNLEVTLREKAGKALPTLRKQGTIPGILYGKKREPQLIQMSEKTLVKATQTEAGFNALFNLKIDGKEEGLARIREYQAHPLRRCFTHVDLQAVDLTEKIEVEVPIHLVGTAKGVKDEGGVLETQRRSLHLRCVVSNIPEHIDIDISALKIGDSIHADDLKLPEGVTFPHETNFTICAVVPPTKEEEVVAPTVAPGEVPLVGKVAVAEGEEAGKEEKKGEAKKEEAKPAKK